MDFLIGPDGEIYRNMEGIGVILSIRYAGDLTELFLIDPDKAAGKPFCRGGQQCEIQACLFAFLIHAAAHITDDLKTQPLAFGAFAVVLSCCTES